MDPLQYHIGGIVDEGDYEITKCHVINALWKETFIILRLPIFQNCDLWQPNHASSSAWVADSSLLRARSESSS
jgi:hypothetical protein